MKKIMFMTGIVSLFSLFLMCEKQSINKISYLRTEEGGCNDMESNELKSAIEEQDTITFSIINDTLDIYVGKNYFCCTPFTTSAKATGDSILITITDPCPLNDASCYCWCMCYYTWDFLFFDYEQKEYDFKVILIDPHEEDPIILWEGKVDLALSN